MNTFLLCGTIGAREKREKKRGSSHSQFIGKSSVHGVVWKVSMDTRGGKKGGGGGAMKQLQFCCLKGTRVGVLGEQCLQAKKRGEGGRERKKNGSTLKTNLTSHVLTFPCINSVPSCRG